MQKRHSAKSCMPKHIAIIMDGNRRWAQLHGCTRLEGHRRGIKALERCVQAAVKHHIPYLTLYAFSSENWSRGEKEVSDLMNLLHYYVGRYTKVLHEKGVKLRFVGDLSKFDYALREKIYQAEELTKHNKALVLVLALSYGGRQDIMQAVRRLLQEIDDGWIKKEEITEEKFSHYLWTSGLPDPDLVARTSGEYRLSNFLLWQSAYSELIFLDVLWPDFTQKHFDILLKNYAKRERRFGKRLN